MSKVMKNIHFLFWTPSPNNNYTSKNYLSGHKNCFICITNKLLVWRQRKLLKSTIEINYATANLQVPHGSTSVSPSRPLVCPSLWFCSGFQNQEYYCQRRWLLVHLTKSKILLSTSQNICLSSGACPGWCSGFSRYINMDKYCLFCERPKVQNHCF